LGSGEASDIEDELGDLLFTVVNLARHLNIDSETALNRSTDKFNKRFRAVEKLAMQGGKSLPEHSLSELDDLCAPILYFRFQAQLEKSVLFKL